MYNLVAGPAHLYQTTAYDYYYRRLIDVISSGRWEVTEVRNLLAAAVDKSVIIQILCDLIRLLTCQAFVPRVTV